MGRRKLLKTVGIGLAAVAVGSQAVSANQGRSVEHNVGTGAPGTGQPYHRGYYRRYYRGYYRPYGYRRYGYRGYYRPYGYYGYRGYGYYGYGPSYFSYERDRDGSVEIDFY
ncbi:hypothetical protein [Haloarchaeobius sp. HME9146]|uniref:hypothetical protein n=1 Tax=Haloarchaeobius sp. HME9146 TaxID=2978732 RepID=UPI0021C03C49|nr:hypothetical protein [Haloarchaeobius sp. HME9146]MCT9098355.1 hypothetical protein [Haloarchaeobius sp. HME9146]